MTISNVEEMIRIFPIAPKKITFTLDEKAYNLLLLDLSLCIQKRDFTGKNELNFNLGTTKITAFKL